MKPPSTMTWLIGNNAVFIALSGLFMYVLWQTATGQMAWWWVIPALYAGHISHKRNGQVRAYTRWKQEWDTMNGVQPRPKRHWPMTGFKRFLAFMAWCVGAYWAVEEAGTPDHALVVFLFWVATLLIVATWVFRLFRRKASRSGGGVTVCVAMPLRVASATDAARALPEYCYRLLGR